MILSRLLREADAEEMFLGKIERALLKLRIQ